MQIKLVIYKHHVIRWQGSNPNIFFFFWVNGNFLMHLAILIVIFLVLNSSCRKCSIANRQWGWMSHIPGPWESVTCCHACPPGMASSWNLICLLVCEDYMLLFCKAYSHSQKWCCGLQENVLSHRCMGRSVAFFCHLLSLSGIPSSLT